MHHPTDRIAHTMAFVTPVVSSLPNNNSGNNSNSNNHNNNNNIWFCLGFWCFKFLNYFLGCFFGGGCVRCWFLGECF